LHGGKKSNRKSGKGGQREEKSLPLLPRKREIIGGTVYFSHGSPKKKEGGGLTTHPGGKKSLPQKSKMKEGKGVP